MSFRLLHNCAEYIRDETQSGRRLVHMTAKIVIGSHDTDVVCTLCQGTSNAFWLYKPYVHSNEVLWYKSQLCLQRAALI